MIGYLSGTPQQVQDKVLIKTGGVGYEVSVGTTTLAQLISMPTAELYIHTHVKEEALELYGFLTLDERSLFRLLLSVAGVGPKTALAIANTGADALRIAVQQADVGFFTAVPRVGKKLAQKIIIELKSKLGSLNELQLDTPTGANQDILSALLALGFDEQSSLRELHLVTEEISELPVEQSIKLIIKRLSKS